MKKILKKVGAVLLALTFWQLAAMRIQSNILLVTPVAVIQRLTTIWREPLFWNSIWFSFYHVALGMAWKAAIAAEIIGAPAGSIGKMMYLSKIYLDTDDLLAWTVIIVALEIFSENLSKAYDEKKVLEHYSAIIREHQCSGIMGRSGSGKTTLLRILMGLEQADEGTIQGKLDRVSVVFQEDRLCEGFSAVANVSAALSRKVTRKQVEENLKAVGLEDSLNVPVCTLSGGMKRRVAIVRACMAEGDLLLFDEPFRGLDQETKRQVAEYIRRKTRGKTVIMTTHDEAELELMHSSQILRFPQ